MTSPPLGSLGRVLVVEDERFTRTMLSSTVAGCGFEVVASCATAPGALAAAADTHVDVALLDLDLGPGPSGIDVAHALRARQGSIGLVFLTTFSDPRIKDPRERNLPRGSRFLVKTRLDDVAILREALLAAVRAPVAPVDVDPGNDELTANQLSVLRHIAAGKTNAQIAIDLEVTEKAVERTVQRILDALSIERSDGNQRVRLARAYAHLAGKSLPGA